MTLTIEDYRRFYADEIRFVANLQSTALVEAFARVPREKFIGPGPWQVGSAEVRALFATGPLWRQKLISIFPSGLKKNLSGYANVEVVGIYSCKSVRDPELEPLVRNALVSQALLRVRSFRPEAHEQDETCLMHGKSVCFSSVELSAD